MRRIVLAALGLAGLAACSEAPRQRAEVPQARATSNPIGEAGTRIFIDPDTGQVREPTSEELAAASRAEVNAPRVKPQPPREIEYPNGAVGVLMGEESLQPLQACLRTDGSVDEMCGHGDGRSGGASVPARGEDR